MNILHAVHSFAPCFSAGCVVNAYYQIARKQVEKGQLNHMNHLQQAVLKRCHATNHLF